MLDSTAWLLNAQTFQPPAPADSFYLTQFESHCVPSSRHIRLLPHEDYTRRIVGRGSDVSERALTRAGNDFRRVLSWVHTPELLSRVTT